MPIIYPTKLLNVNINCRYLNVSDGHIIRFVRCSWMQAFSYKGKWLIKWLLNSISLWRFLSMGKMVDSVYSNTQWWRASPPTKSMSHLQHLRRKKGLMNRVISIIVNWRWSYLNICDLWVKMSQTILQLCKLMTLKIKPTKKLLDFFEISHFSSRNQEDDAYRGRITKRSTPLMWCLQGFSTLFSFEGYNSYPKWMKNRDFWFLAFRHENASTRYGSLAWKTPRIKPIDCWWYINECWCCCQFLLPRHFSMPLKPRKI